MCRARWQTSESHHSHRKQSHAAQQSRRPRYRDARPSLYQSGAVSRDRPARDRARAGRLRLRHGRQGLYRRHGRAVVHGARPRQRGTGRGGARGRCASSPSAHLFSGKSHDGAIELAEKLKEIAPVPTSKVFFCNSGSEANDTQIKLVWYMNNALGRPRKKKIISRLKAYHGVTIASASLTGLPAQPDRFRPADRRHPAHQLSAPLPLRACGRERGGVRDAARRRARGADPAGRAGHGRGLHRRAGDGRRRRDRAAEELFRRRSRRSAASTTST